MRTKPVRASEPPNVSATVARERSLLDATVRLLGRGGPAAVTHRAVAREAGVSLGVVTYRYPTIDGLLEAAMHHLCGVELGELTELAMRLSTQAFDLEAWTGAFAKAIAADVRRDRESEIASFELLLDVARHPRLRAAASSAGLAYERLAELALRAAGSTDPERHSRILVAAILGLELKQLAHPRPHFEEELRTALRVLVTGLVASP